MTSAYHIARIAVGVVAMEFEGDAQNQSVAWSFLHEEIAKHHDDVAVVIQRDDGLRLGEIWANYSALPFVDSINLFRRYLTHNAF
ncbi:MAG: hypothetical protein VB141_12785, partial [Burkholderia gladioli]